MTLLEAAKQRLTLVTYDRRTIPPLLKSWAEAGRAHGGVTLVDDKTIAPSNIGALVWALAELIKKSFNPAIFRREWHRWKTLRCLPPSGLLAEAW